MTQIFIWTLSDVISIALAILIVVLVAFGSLREWTKQNACKHDEGVNETQACNAICQKCGKNLGFIGTWRAKK
jgi:hypothetical protein